MLPFTKSETDIGANMYRLVATALDCSFVLRHSLTLTVLKGVKMSIIMFYHNFNATVFPLKFVKYSKMLMGLQRYIFLRQRITYASLMTNPARFNIRMSHTQYPTKLRYLLLSVIRLTSSVAVCILFLFYILFWVNFADR